MENNTSLIMYTTEDGITKIQATFDNDTVWLSKDQMLELAKGYKTDYGRYLEYIAEN